MTDSDRIIPFLWFDDHAEEAVNHYVSIFEDADVGDISRYTSDVSEISGRPKGSVMTVSFRLAGQDFTALNGGPLFEFTPAISLFVNCADAQEVDRLYAGLAEGGTVLMPLQAYPFSDRYAWVQDRFGVAWQLIAAPRPRKIAPCLMFVGDQCGRAGEAMQRYTEIFSNSGIESIARWEAGEQPNAEGTVKHAVFWLAGQEFRAMDSALAHDFTFNEAVSLQVSCDSQEEIDHYWDRLADGADPAAQRCGWLKDRFGVSWQIVPTALPEMLRDPDPLRVARVTQAFLQMRKFDIGVLRRAFDGDRP